MRQSTAHAEACCWIARSSAKTPPRTRPPRYSQDPRRWRLATTYPHPDFPKTRALHPQHSYLDAEQRTTLACVDSQRHAKRDPRSTSRVFLWLERTKSSPLHKSFGRRALCDPSAATPIPNSCSPGDLVRPSGLQVRRGSPLRRSRAAKCQEEPTRGRSSATTSAHFRPQLAKSWLGTAATYCWTFSAKIK